MFSAFQLEGNVSAGDDYQSGRLLHAYHEAGHALVGHVIGRCIEEVSIAMRYDGYGGYVALTHSSRMQTIIPNGATMWAILIW